MMKEARTLASPNAFVQWILVFLGIASISSASILIRLADAPALTIAAYRVTLAALILSPWLVHRKTRSRQGRSPRLWGATFLSGVFLAFHFVFWIHSLGLTSVANSVTLVSTTPLFVAMFSYLWLHEGFHRRLGFGVLCTLIGAGLVAGTDFSFSTQALLGDCLAILGAVMAAGYLITGRYVRRFMELPVYAFGAYGAAALVLLVCSAFTHTPLTGFSQKTYLFLVLLALVPQLIGHTIFNWVLKFMSATVVAVLILGEPIGATFLAFVFLGETISRLQGAGLLVLALGILMSSLTMPQNSSSAPEPSSTAPAGTELPRPEDSCG